jgi:predicted MFS family arabinose efflux permease
MQSQITDANPKKPSITGQAILFAFTRMVLNTNTRMFYPFLAVFARGLGVDIAEISIAISARSFVGDFEPIYGSRC